VPDLSRRDLLKLAALGLGAMAANAVLAACGSRSSAASLLPTSTLTPTGTPPPTPTPVPATPTPTPTPAPTAAPDLVVVRNGEPAALVRRAIATLGGMERFVPQGASVVVKPNICVAYRTYEYAATTNPWVVGELVKMAFEAGASSVKVLDYPYGGSGADAYVKSGIQEQVQAAGGEMVVMSSRRFVSTPIPDGKWLKKTDVYEEILKADVIINVPIAKTHGSSRVTAAMKNLMGIVRDRQTMHGKLGQAIADLNTLVKPQLTVLDAVRILTAYGPSGGKLSYVKKLDTVVAGTDPVAIDAYAATLLGLKPTDLDYVKIGAAMGLGQSDLSKLKIEELTA
jgi:uncharacterized protein (DUF362 family)